MRITKAMLEQEIQDVKANNATLSGENALYRREIKTLSDTIRGTTTLTIALERSTQAVAHIISDLNKRR